MSTLETEVSMATTYTAGTIIACFMSQYSDEEPQLGKLTKECDINCETFEIEWMLGMYSEPWQLWKQKHGRSYRTWKEVIPSNAVLFPIKLSNVGRLSNSLVVKAYEQKRNST